MVVSRQDAICIALGAYGTPNGKVAHGLVRDGERFRVRAVIDPRCAGRDAGEVLDGIARGVPIVATVAEALERAGAAEVAVVGVATHGGRLISEVRAAALEAARAGLSLVSGLHDALADDAEIAEVAAARGLRIIDLRAPVPRRELRFWTGEIAGVKTPRVAVLGTDCALGKRTTARMVTAALGNRGVRAEMIYTGQTGWMQGGRFGIILDALPNDYVSGELEGAICACERECAPDVMILEGQSSLRNPSGPCGAELILSGGARGVILQHAPGRRYFEGYEAQRLEIPDVAGELELLRCYGAEVLALALNGEGLSLEGLRAAQAELAARLGVPCVCPLEDGAEGLASVVGAYLGR